MKRGDQWVGYEDPISVKIKMAYVRATGIGGVSLWSLDLDDFQVINDENILYLFLFNIFNDYSFSFILIL